ncbi:hypothetical protein ABK040_001046 [Willaertia magna]
MSNAYYEGLLSEVLVEIRELLLEENQLSDKSVLPKVPYDQLIYYQKNYSSLFVKYVLIFNKLEDCYDQLLQPQKREDLKVIVEYIICRILEIDSVLRKLIEEYYELDETLIDLKVIPEHTEINIPRYIREENEKEIKRREILLDILRKRNNLQDNEENYFEKNINFNMNINQAILVIQTNERARQGSVYAKEKKQRRDEEEKKALRSLYHEEALTEDEASIKIQKYFKGYRARKKIEQEKASELKFIGMIPKEEGEIDSEEEDDSTKDLERYKRKIKQIENKRELEEQRINMREKIIEEEGPKMMEDMHDALIEQILLYKQEYAGGVPDFPTEAEGGSKLFMQNIAKASEEQKKLIEEQKNQMSQKDTKKTNKATTKPPPKPKPGKQPEQPQQQQTFLEDESKVIALLVDALKKFVEKWKDKYSALDFDQKFDPTLLRKELMEGDNGIEEELRKRVDNQIRQELENLKAALESETLPPKKVPPKDDKVKPVVIEPPKLPSTEAFFSELVSLEIIKKVQPFKLNSYIGELRLMGSKLGWEEPSMGQVRNICKQVVLTMSSKSVHQQSPHLKSMLFVGQKGTGKTMLVHAMAHELGATLIDMSSSIVNNTHKEPSETNLLIGKIFRVAKDMQPAIVYMDEFDCVVRGKTKNKTKPNLKRYRKPLLAQIKALLPGERILFVGNCREPWDADNVSLEEFFDRIIYTPVPDHASSLLLWKTLIEKVSKQVVSNDFNIYTLPTISESYSSGGIATVVNNVISDRRRIKLKENPLTIDEFIGPLAKVDPVYPNDDQKMKAFLQKLSPQFRKKTKEEREKEKQTLSEVKKEEKKKRR